MVQGAGGGGWEYDLWRPVWEKRGWQVVAPDFVPAKGGLEKTALSDYVAQVRSWTPTSGKVVLVGASMGGLFALKAAEVRTASAVVLVNSVAPLEVKVPRKSGEYPKVVKWANGPRQETVDSMPDSDAKTIDWAWKRWRDESGAVMGALAKGVSAKKPKCPALCVLGEKDTDIPFSTGLAIAKWSSADVQLYTGMSHMGPLMSRRAVEVASAVCNWLDSRLV